MRYLTMNMSILMSTSDQKALSKYFKHKGILYQPGLGIIFGVNAGILLSQLLYWNGKGKKEGWVYKTIEDMRLETGLTITQQNTAIKVLKSHGILETKNMRVPQTRHFRINMHAIHETVRRLKKTYKLNYPNPTEYYVGNTKTLLQRISRKLPQRLRTWIH